MKKVLALTAALIVLINASAQKPVADSLRVLLAKATTDTNRVTLLWNMASASNIYNPDTALLLSQEALFLAQKIKFAEGESRALGVLANSFLKIGNYPKALESYLKKLKIEEKGNNPYNLASVIMNIGIVYTFQEEYRKALPYYFKADSIIRIENVTKLEYNSALNLGDLYDRLNVTDSAFIFFNRSLLIANRLANEDYIGASQVGIGHCYLKQEKYDMALQNYKESIYHLQLANDEDLICEAAIGLSKLYYNQVNYDSAKHYSHLALKIAQKDGFQSRELDAAEFLTNIYKREKKFDSAFKFLALTNVLRESISSKERVRESQILSTNEQLRQLELAETKRKAKKERDQQLQLLFIGIFIPAFFLMTLLLSRIKMHIGFIKFMGIISLLILFEYLTLLLHPYVVEITNHTPFYEMLIFVSIAAFLIPAHHRVEHWFIEKLTQRRNLYEEKKLQLRKLKLKIKKPSN
jgi:tetratricopeptide (TPR) repeat protein